MGDHGLQPLNYRDYTAPEVFAEKTFINITTREFARENQPVCVSDRICDHCVRPLPRRTWTSTRAWLGSLAQLPWTLHDCIRLQRLQPHRRALRTRDMWKCSRAIEKLVGDFRQLS